MDSNSRVNILLVDDQPGKLLTYEAVLAELDENLVCASSAREALELLLRETFAVILVDVCMPGQDGFELVETIRQHHRYSETAIIFVSAIQLTDVDHIRGYSSGAVDYVSVPVVPEILRAKVAVFVDRYRKSRELELLNAELEQRVLERTARLQETEEALREADRRKDFFLATLAHELRNPLAPMRSSLDLLSQVDEVALHQTAVEVMDRQLKQMVRLVDDLVDLARIKRSDLELRIVEGDLAEVLRGGIEAAVPNIDRCHQKLVVDQPAGRITIRADLARISQVVSNLLNNASKYTPEQGQISLTLEVSGNDLTIRVEDSGVGIELDELPYVFDPFYQVENVNGEPKSGLGIGLTLVKTIVEAHGGTVEAKSHGRGSGAEFVVKLSCVVSIDATSSAPTSRPSKYASAGELIGVKVLVADDNRDAATVLALLLTELGIQVLVANDGADALAQAESHRPDFMILDIGMPIMDGYKVAEAVRRCPWGEQVVLIAATGWGQAEDRRKTAESGFDHHLVKPVAVADLMKVITNSRPEAATTR